MTRYYYTCPTKAAYMSKYFKVNFVGTNNEKLNLAVNDGEVSWYYPEISIGENGKRLTKFLRYVLNKFFVAKKSEEIFKFKNLDLVSYGFGSVDFYNQLTQKNFVNEIIRQDNKQFFMPEVENE